MSSQVHHRSIDSSGKQATSELPWSRWTPTELMLGDDDESDGVSLLYPPSLASSGMSSTQSSLETCITPEGFNSTSPLSLRCNESDSETAHCISIIPDRKMRIASGDEINAQHLQIANPDAVRVNWSQWSPTTFQCKFCHERFLKELQLQEHLQTHKRYRKELPRKKKQKRSQVCISSSVDSSRQISDHGALPDESTANQDVINDLSNLSLSMGERYLHTDANLTRLGNTLSLSLTNHNGSHVDGDGAIGIEPVHPRDDFKDSTILESVTTSIKQNMMARMMGEFMVIMKQDWSAQIQTHGIGSGSRPANEPTNTSGTHFRATSSYSDQPKSRECGDDEGRGGSDDEDGDDDQRPPKRPRTSPSSEQALQDDPKFACPYRKHDPRKYCVREWRPCALTPLDTIARVKAHLYRHHRIFQCPRCKCLFPNQLVVDEHLMKLQGCEPSRISLAEGITTEIEKKLRSRKKTSRNQTDSDRWIEIYKILFPTSILPSPYFEPVEEHTEQSPESQRLADLEDYTKRELPRVFWAALEEVVSTEMQPVEERLRTQLMSVFRGCQDRVFSTYESMLASNADFLGQGDSAGTQLSTIFEPLTRQNPKNHRSDDRAMSSSAITIDTGSQKGSSSNLAAINSSSTLSSAYKSSTTLNSIYSSTTTLSSIASSLATSSSQQVVQKSPENHIGNTPWAIGPNDGILATAASSTSASALPGNFWSTELEDLDMSHFGSDILWDNEVPMEENQQWLH